VIAVASGKGGVGKSSVTVNLACALAAEGHRVGILDADVWGFSVPRMMGVTGKPVGFNDMILPMESHGVKVISMGFFVPEETPVIWRGPMLHKAIEQFLGDVYWGDLDFLLCDLPPGTGDVSISLASFLPGASMLVVTTPQEAARKVAERAGKMAERTNLRPIGVIENMSWFVCPHCGEPTPIFGQGRRQRGRRDPGRPAVRAGAARARAARGRRRRRPDRRDGPGLTRGRGPPARRPGARAHDPLEGRQAAPSHGCARCLRDGRRPPRPRALRPTRQGTVRSAGPASPAVVRSSRSGDERAPTAHAISVTMQMTETVSPVHWLPVRPNTRLSTRRKSSSTRVAP
jgi:Mrp family chromosome partitioning ATPase